MTFVKKLGKYAIPLIVIGVGIFGARMMIAARPEPPKVAIKPPAVLVEVATAARQAVTFTVQSQGSISPRTRTTLVAEVSGQIVEVAPAFVAGGFFKKGDVLVRVDPSNYQNALKRAEAGVKRAETQVATENALAGYAAQDWERLRSLNATRGPASDLTLRKPQLAEALAELDSAEADYQRALRDLERTVIRAPYDGMVREKRADVGQFVNTGTALAESFATDVAEVRLPLTQADLRFVQLPRPGETGALPVKLHAQVGGAQQTWDGLVVRSEGVFDESQRVLHVVAQIPDPYEPPPGAEPARVGTFVTAEITGRTAGRLFVIPRHSLSRGDTLWIVGDDMKIQPQTVQIVRSDRDYAYIDGGLDEGERYCVTPPAQPLPGMEVRLDDDRPGSGSPVGTAAVADTGVRRDG